MTYRTNQSNYFKLELECGTHFTKKKKSKAAYLQQPQLADTSSSAVVHSTKIPAASSYPALPSAATPGPHSLSSAWPIPAA